MSKPAAAGSRTLIGFAREAEPGVPGTEALTYYKPTLALDLDQRESEEPSGGVNPSGFLERGIAAAKEGVLDFGHRLTPAHLLDWFEHILRGSSYEVPQDGVGVYTFEGDSTRDQTSLWALKALAPVERGLYYNLHCAGIEWEWADNSPIQARLVDGSPGSSTDLSQAVALGPPGYTEGPWIRGQLAEPDLGPVYLRVTKALDGLEVKAHQTLGVPTFPGTALVAPYDPVQPQRAVWMSLLGAVTVSGTVTVTGGGFAVVGTDTRFSVELEVGMSIDIAGETHTVASITSDTQLTLNGPHVAGATGVELAKLNRDLGVRGENHNPLEAIFPGTRADHRAGFGSTLTGTVTVGAGTDAVAGVGTQFLDEVNVGDQVLIGGESHVVDSISADDALRLVDNHVSGAAAVTMQRHAASAQLTGTIIFVPASASISGLGTAFLSELNVGDIIDVGGSRFEVATVTSDSAATLTEPIAAVPTGTAWRVASTWRFDVDWTEPAATYLTGHLRLTPAQVTVRLRPYGGEWQEYQGIDGKCNISWPGSWEGGWGTRDPGQYDRDGELMATIELKRSLRSPDFIGYARSHQRFEMELRKQGPQLGDGTVREGIVVYAPAAVVVTSERPASGASRVEESITIQCETDDAGSSPVRITCTSRRTDWRPWAG